MLARSTDYDQLEGDGAVEAVASCFGSIVGSMAGPSIPPERIEACTVRRPRRLSPITQDDRDPFFLTPVGWRATVLYCIPSLPGNWRKVARNAAFQK